MDMIDKVASALTARIKSAPEGSEMRKLLFFERRDLARTAIAALRNLDANVFAEAQAMYHDLEPTSFSCDWNYAIDAILVNKRLHPGGKADA